MTDPIARAKALLDETQTYGSLSPAEKGVVCAALRALVAEAERANREIVRLIEQSQHTSRVTAKMVREETADRIAELERELEASRARDCRCGRDGGDL